MPREPRYPQCVNSSGRRGKAGSRAPDLPRGAVGAATFLAAWALATGCVSAAEPAFRYRFTAGDIFTYRVVQESRPAQGPSVSRGDLEYRFSVAEADARGARLTAVIRGRGTRGPDAASGYEEARAGRVADLEEVRVSFRIGERGLPVGADGRLDETALGLAPGREYPEGSPEWAMAWNVAQFFPVIGEGAAARFQGTVFGPDLFRRYPDDRPELTGLMWTREPITYAMQVPRSLGTGKLLRVDFAGGFTKQTTHRGVQFRGTYAANGFAVLDPDLGRPVAFLMDDAASHYKIEVTGGSFLARKVAEGRLRSANGGVTPIRLEAVDPGYLEQLSGPMGLRLLATPEVSLALPAEGGASPQVAMEPDGSLLGM